MDWKIAHILGKGDGHKEINEIIKEPISTRGVIYGVNDAFLRTPEVDITIHMHDLAKLFKQENTASSTRLCITRANKDPKKEFISINKYHKIPHCQEYPLEEICNYYKLPLTYFTSGIEYIIAYSAWRAEQEGSKLEDMYYYGCNMTVKQEYIEQIPGMHFWTGMMMGKGINVYFQHKYTSLLKTKDGSLYGYNIRQYRL